MPKSKGELKKRLYDAGIDFQPLLHRANNIIDEARKEFPIWWLSEDRVYKYHELTDAQKKIATLHSVDDKEAIKWYNKWFGDSDDQS